MAHEIAVDKEGEMMAYAGVTPWHGLGVKAEELMTTSEAMELARLNWNVEKRQVFYKCEITNELKEMDNTFTTVRYDDTEECEVSLCRDGKAVGIRYTPFQNSEAFSFLDDLVNEQAAMIEVVGALGKGERVWILAKLPNHIMVGDKDQVNQYLLISNTHDGTGSIRILPTPIRVVCNNTLTWGLQRGKGIGSSLRHTINVRNKVEDVKEALKIVNTQFDDLSKVYNQMKTIEMDREQIVDYFEDSLGLKRNDDDELSTRATNTIKEIIKLLDDDNNKVDGMEGTLWSAYNALTQYIDYNFVLTKDGEVNQKRLESSQFGSGADTKKKGWKVANEIIMEVTQ